MNTDQQQHITHTLVTRLAVLCGAGAVACVLDQVTKLWVRTSIPEGTAVPFIPGVMELFHVSNTGAAFSVGSGNALFFVALTAVVIAVLVSFVVREKNLSLPLIALLGGVAGGGIGNAIDRTKTRWGHFRPCMVRLLISLQQRLLILPCLMWRISL